jgi:hypothetical protein
MPMFVNTTLLGTDPYDGRPTVPAALLAGGTVVTLH